MLHLAAICRHGWYLFDGFVLRAQPIDFDKQRNMLAKTYGVATDEALMSHIMYPKVIVGAMKLQGGATDYCFWLL